MFKSLKNLFINITSYFGFNINRQTEKSNVEKLISSLYPRLTTIKMIRMGPHSDGGYLLPDDLININYCFSPGVSDISGFEDECIKKRIKVFMADRTVDKPLMKSNHEDFDFIKKHIGVIIDSDHITMDEWVRTKIKDDESDIIIQMDIEGYEYLAIINMSEYLLKRVRIFIIEFHDLHHMWNIHLFEKFNLVFNKLLQTHSVVHIHPNSISGLDFRNGVYIPKTPEFTFLRNDRDSFEGYVSTFPNPLDYANSEKQDMPLPVNWFFKS